MAQPLDTAAIKQFTSGDPVLTRIKDLVVDKPAIIRGRIVWVSKAGKNFFITFRDGPFGRDRMQVVLAETLWQAEVRTGAVVSFTGHTMPKPDSAELEFHATSCHIIGASTERYTKICPRDASAEVAAKMRHFSIRRPTDMVLAHINHKMLDAIDATFADMGCLKITPPSFIKSRCEGGAALFKINNYPSLTSAKPMSDVFLTESSQFYLEYEAQAHLQHVGCVAPSFRAEKSTGPRHLTEFIHCEVEFVYVETLDQHVALLKQFLSRLMHHFIALAGELVKELSPEVFVRLQRLVAMTDNIVMLSHLELIAKLNEQGRLKEDGTPYLPADDVKEADEKFIINQYDAVVFLYGFPAATKAFCVKPLDTPLDDVPRVMGIDVEFPGVGEVFGSGVRAGADLEALTKVIIAQDAKPEDYAAYLDIRREGWVPTSGFGLGVGRFMCFLLDMDHITKVVEWPCRPGKIF